MLRSLYDSESRKNSPPIRYGPVGSLARSSLVLQGICAVKREDQLEALGMNGISITLYAFKLNFITIVYCVLFYIFLKVQLR